MGIQGLLPFLKKIHTPVNVAQFEGCTVAIDAYCWLHKGAFSCADKLALGEKTDQYVYYCMKFLEFMLRKNIKPIMVFDGCHLPSKKDVEKSRREKRDMYRKKAALMLREGRRAEARECLQRCIDISPDMALELMNTCRTRGIDCIVAPYEADAQLAYLNRSGIAQVIVTEDSDLLLFGCDKIIFKMDYNGNGILIEKSRLNEVLGINSGVYSFERFRYMCILSGCDYLPSLSGIGLVKACKVFKLARQTDLKQVLKKFPSTYLKMSMVVPAEYIEGFIKANNTFLYQLVFDPLKRELVPLTTYPPDINKDELHYAGPYIAPHKALQIALGNINIYTGEKFADFNPDTYVPTKASKKPANCLHQLSIWNKNYRIRPHVELKDNQNVQRPNLWGKEKECMVKFHNKSPVKRLRPAEECKESKSDMELSDMYMAKSDAGTATPTKSPQRKKFKAEEVVSRREILKKFSFSSKHTPISDEEEEDDVESSPRRSPVDKKLFISSLKEADNEVSINTISSQGSTSVINELITEKENVVSPRKNRFAVLLPTTRPRFDINARKEVKSRFFVTSTNTGKQSEDSHMVDDTESSSLKPTEAADHQKPESQTPKTKSPSPQFKTKTKSPHRASSKSPAGSAFSWSKFKFTRDSPASDSSSSINLQHKESPVNSQFKKVISDSDLTRFFDKPSSFESENHSQQSSDTDNRSEDDGGVVNSQISSVDSYCSIDSFCLVPEVSCNDSQREDDDMSNSTAEKKQHADAVTQSLTQQNIHSASNSKSSEKAKSAQVGIKGKGGCRVSGLTKGSRSSKSSSDKINSKQRSVKDMFSQFAHSKSNVARLKKSQSSPAKFDDDIEVLGMTPSQNKTDFSVLEGAQRKLLP